MEKFLHRGDYDIFRNHPYYPGCAVVLDCDGELVVSVTKTWTDEQIETAIALANRWYGFGHRDGGNEKIHDLKKLLKIQK